VLYSKHFTLLWGFLWANSPFPTGLNFPKFTRQTYGWLKNDIVGG
jgi:hypothetical protein